MPGSPQRRRLLTYNLRTLLAAMTLCALALGWWVGTARQQRAAVLALEQTAVSTQVLYDIQRAAGARNLAAQSWVPQLVFDRLGPDFFHNVVEVNLHFGSDTSARAGIGTLLCLRRLERLAIPGDGVYDAELAQLATLGRLRRLDLNAWNITDDGLKNLTAAAALETLVLRDAWDISDRGLAYLAALPNLEDLTVHHALITAAGIRSLAAAGRLTSLSLTGPQIGDDVISPLAHVSSLEMIDLSRARITVKALPALNSLPRLRELRLSGDIQGNTATLHEQLPKCKIVGLARVPRAKVTQVKATQVNVNGSGAAPAISE